VSGERGLEDAGEDVRNWASSGEGKRAIKDALARSKRAAEGLRRARRVDLDELRRPVTL